MYGNARCASIIENLSEEGIYVVTTPSDVSLEFTPETPAELRFKIPSGETLNLHCKIKWSYKNPPHGLTNSVGMEIINPPFVYKASLRDLE